MNKIDYKEIQKNAIRNVVNTAKKKKESSISDIQEQAINKVSDSIRNKDAVYRTYEAATPEDTVRSKLRRIARIGEYDKDAAKRKYDEFMAQRRDKKSKFYDPYTESTHSSVKKLQDLGYDVGNIDDKWFKDNSWYKDYLTLNEYTNSVKKPGKRASREEKAAYEIYQLKKAEENTRKAEKEQEDLRKYLTEAATSKDRTMRDDEIIASIDWKKYPTLAKMRQYAANGAPMALTRGVAGSSKDWGYGVLWAAMNNGGTGNSDSDIANSAMQAGNTWAKLNYQNRRQEQYRRELNKIALEENINNQDVERQKAEQRYLRFMEQRKKDALAENINNQDVERQRAEQLYQRWMRQEQDNRRQSVGPEMQRAEQNYMHWLDRVNQMQKEDYFQDVLTGEETNGKYSPEQTKASVRKFIEANQWQQDQRRKGTFDSGDDVTLKSNEGVRQDQSYWANQVTNADERIEELKAQKEDQERKDWYPDIAMQEWDDLHTGLIEGEFSNGEDVTMELDNRNSQQLKEWAENYFKWEMDKLPIATTEEQQEQNRKTVFNGIFVSLGENEAYETVTEMMTPEGKAEFDRLLDNIIEDMRNPYGTDSEIDRMIKDVEAEKQNAMIMRDKATAEAQARAEIIRLEAMATGDGQYREQDVRTRSTTEGEMYHYIAGGDDVDMSVYYANHPWLEEMQEFYGSEGYYKDAEPHWTKVKAEYFMTDEQIKKLNDLYGEGTPEEKENAKAYLDALKQIYLDPMKTKYQEEQQRENARGSLGFLEGAGTIPVNIVTGMMGLGATVATLFGNEAAKNPNSEWYTLQRYVTNTRDERGNVWDEGLVNAFGDSWKGVGKFLNGVTYSMADNIAAMATTSGLGEVFNFDMAGKTAERLIQVVMSGEATSATMLEQLKAGREPAEAAIMAIGGGLIEALTEKYSIEALLHADVKEMLGNGKQLLKFLGKNTLAEGSEEGASDILNLILDESISALAGHESEIRAQINALKKEKPWLTDREAQAEVAKQWIIQLGTDIGAGALSGLIMSGGRVALNGIAAGKTGAKINLNNKAESVRASDKLVEAALKMDKGTQSYQIASKIKEKKGKASNQQIGRLVQNIYHETDEKIGKAAQTVVENRAYELLEGKDTGGMDRREAAQLIAKAVSGEELSRKEQKTLAKNKDLFSVAKEFLTISETSTQTFGDISDEVRTELGVRDSVSELTGMKKAAEADTSDVETTRMADENEIAEAEQAAMDGRGKKTGTSRDVVVNGEYGQITGITNTDGKTFFTVDVNGTTQRINVNDASTIRATDFGTAAIIRQATVVNKGLYQASANQTDNNFRQYTDILLDAQANGKAGNIGTFLANAERVRIAAFTGQAMPVVNMDGGTALEIYRNSALEHKANRESMEQTGIRTARGAGNGRVTFQGAEYGTDAWNKALESVDEISRGEMETAAEIARRSGMDLTFYTAEEARQNWKLADSEDIDLYYGSENRSGIAINIGENNVNRDTGERTGRHHIMVTFGHEMTHWLQRNSLKGYTQLEQFVTGELLRTQGENYLNKRLGEIMEEQGLSLEDAMSELVADSSDQILASEEVQKHIAETNQSLFTEIKGFVTNLVTRIKNAVMGMSESQSRDAQVLNMMRSANRLAKVWLGAYDEAISGKIAGAMITEAEQNPSEHFSMAQPIEMRKDGLVAVHNMSVGGYMKSVQLGAMPGASFAVIPEGTLWDKYGEVSLFTDMLTINPKWKNSVLYMKDAGTPMLGGDFKTIEEAEQYLRNQPSRGIIGGPAEILRTVKIVRSLDEARQRLQRGAELTKEEKQNIKDEQDKRSVQLSHDIADFMRERAGEGNFYYDDTVIGEGILNAAEAIDLLDPKTFEDKWQIINGFVRSAMVKRNIWNDEYDMLQGEDGKQIAKEILDFIEYIDKTTYTDMMEAKSYIRTDGSRTAAILFPKSVPSYVVDAATEFGIDRSRIFFYDENDANGPESRIEMMKKIPHMAEGVRFSKATIDTTEYKYKELINKPDMRIHIIEELSDEQYRNDLSKETREFAKEIINEVKQQNSGKPEIHNNDTGKNIGIVVESIKHSIGRKLQKNYAQICHNLKPILENAIAVNELNERQPLSNYSTLLIGAYETGDTFTAVRFNVNNRTWKADEFDILYSIAKNDIKKEGPVIKTPGLQAYMPDSGSPSYKMSIADLLNVVKNAKDIATVFSEDVAKNLEIERPYDPNISDGLRFSKAELDPKQQELSKTWQDARDEANELREQLRNMKPEVDAWVERISEAQKDGNMDAVMAEYKEWEKGYTKVKNDLDKAEKRFKEANKAYDDYIEQRDVAEEQKKIEASGLSEPEYRRKQAVDVFGYTTDFREAGYMLPNGRMLNFSGEKGKHYGSRGEDHRGIGQIYASSEYQGGAAMMAFMRDGNIRVMAETPGVDIVASQEPTAEQYAAIRNMARRFAGEEYFNVDFTDDRGYNVDSIEYDGRVNPERVVNDIKTFYKTGSAPKQSTVSQFHYSRATSLGLDVGRWMSEQTPGSLLTESERELLSKYKGLRVSIDLSLKKQEDYKRDIRRMQANESQLTAHEREDLETMRFKLKNEEQKYTDLQYKLYQVTSADGYAGMMYQSNMILNDFVLGKTQKQVSESVDNMVKEMQKARTEIEKQSADLKKLAETQAVQTMKSYLQSTSLSFAAKSLKKELNSKMNAAEVENRLAEMALKKANGESIVEDARALAYDMTNQMRGYQLDVMERMRGVTITIGPDQQAEMKGNGMTLASVREALKGTGVRVKYGTFSSLDTDTQEGGDLRTLLPELPAEISENSADALNRFISWAQSQRDADLEAKQSMVDLDDATISVIALASTVTTEMTNDPAAKKQIDKLMKQVKDLSGRTEAIAGKMDSIIDQMDNVEMAGLQAKGSASVLQRDVHTAIDYFNKIAKIAAQEERMRVKKDVIEKLRSENTRNLIKQQMKYEEMMKNDRKARELAEDNKVLRNRITTVAKRAANRLFNETDQKNIPEEAKPLARKMLELLTNHDYVGYRHVLFYDKEQLERAVHSLDSYRNRDGDFNPDRDLNWLIVGSGENADTENADMEIAEKAYQALMDIESGLLAYRQAEGQKNISLMDRKAALQKIQTAVSEIWSMIDARANAEINHRKMLVEEIALQAQDDMQHSRFKGENTGVIGHGKKAVKAAVFYGNMTPEYFFKMLRNNTIIQLYEEYHRAENKYGLLADKTTRKIAEIADRYGFGTWDQKKTYTFHLEKGGEVELTLGEIMSLCATWQREAMNQAELNGPEKSFHLEIGGFVTEAKEKHKINGREFFNQRPHRVTQNDINAMLSQMTDDQKNYMYDLVTYITKEIGELGNEASMRMYGIKKFKEKFYFPMKVWNGVLARKSDAGTQQKTDNRTAHNSASKRRTANANNALLIRDFTKVVCEHTEMQLRYNTFAPAIEFMNRTMNQQLKVETGDPEGYTKRTLEAAFREAYGEEAGKYYRRFLEDINGGVNRSDANIYDKLLSTFKKSAVAGSMSVAFQQPLSFIRAGIMVNPKYLVTSVSFNPAAIKKTAEEMWKYSGVAVIKKIGKFDMNYGRSTIDYMTPEAKKGKFKAGYEWLSDKTTALPELMDTWTWCNMWNSVKKEQAALNPGMDTKSDEFLEKVAERFNDVMRKTQVYDSVLVKSQNMRSTDKYTKALTSFMSEPTLTLNVLADAFGEMKAGDKGGKAKFAKAATTFLLSAVMQALVKGLISAGRNPQERKTWDENVAYRFTSSLISEINPVSLIPGYSDLMTLFQDGEVSDDALGVIGNMIEAVKTGKNWITGDSENPWYRDLEDSIGVITQLFSNIPLKNLVRDVRAISNYIVAPWADRENSMAVLKYQALDLLHNANNMTGAINAWAGDKGWQTNNDAYFQRIYAADKAGDKTKVAGLMEYLTKARGTKESKINEAVRGLTKEDKKLTNEEKIAKLRDQGMKDSDIAKWITDQYSKKQLTKEEATKLYQLANPKANANDAYFAMERKDEGVTGTSSDYFRLDEAIEQNDSAAIRQAENELMKHGYTKEQIEEHKNNLWWKKDREDYKKATGKEVTDTHYRLEDAISANRSEQIQKAVRQMIDHGSSENGIQSWISKEYKAKYLRATGDEKRRLKDALTKALKATGMTEEKAIKRIDGWKESKKK